VVGSLYDPVYYSIRSDGGSGTLVVGGSEGKSAREDGARWQVVGMRFLSIELGSNCEVANTMGAVSRKALPFGGR
jgi:hypothetical protein